MWSLVSICPPAPSHKIHGIYFHLKPPGKGRWAGNLQIYDDMKRKCLQMVQRQFGALEELWNHTNLLIHVTDHKTGPFAVKHWLNHVSIRKHFEETPNIKKKKKTFRDVICFQEETIQAASLGGKKRLLKRYKYNYNSARVPWIGLFPLFEP